MKKDDIKTLIVVIIVCAVCLALVFILSRKKNIDTLKPVEEYNTYFSVTNYMNSYISYLANNDREAIYNMLSSEYIYKNNINQNNILNIVKTYNQDSMLSLKITSIDEIKIKNDKYIYYIKGKIIKNTFESDEVIDNNYNVLLLADYSNLTEAVYPLDEEKYETIINNIKDINITKNKYNKIKSSSITSTETICVLYLSDYVEKLNNNIEEAYDNLNSNMKNKYQNVNEFKEYINSNKDNITTKADKCTKNGKNYIVIDSNNNTYTFTEQSVMKYKVDIKFNS